MLAECLVVLLKPCAGVFAVGALLLGGHEEELLNLGFEFGGVDVKISSEVAWLRVVVGDGDSSGGGDEFIHRWRVRGDDDCFATHGFDNVVPPSFGE